VRTALEEVLQDDTAGAPIRGVQWTRQTPANLSRAVRRHGFRGGRTTIRRLLRQCGSTLRVHRQRVSRRPTPNRDRPMRSSARQRRRFLQAGWPVISVETKKQEVVGHCRHAGQTGRRAPGEGLAPDFPSAADGQARPYGVYALQRPRGDIALGPSHPPAELAVATSRPWWQQPGRVAYAGQAPWLLWAESGGANRCRSWCWKAGVPAVADEFPLPLPVLPYPPGASQGKPMAQRRLSPLRQHWAGQPLVN
jgi:hypothetical protein